MIRTTPPPAASHPVDMAHSRQGSRAVYTIPVRELVSRAHQENHLRGRGHIQGMLVDQAIGVRVDWDGSAASTGQFEVQVAPDAWHACKLIDPGNHNDVVSPATEVAGQIFRARFQRGPCYPSHAFSVKAIPITWTQALPACLDPGYVAVRGEDYVYAGDASPELAPWMHSELADGIQTLTLELAIGQDYEVWVRLQDPQNATRWRVQDPIVRTGGGGGNPF